MSFRLLQAYISAFFPRTLILLTQTTPRTLTFSAMIHSHSLCMREPTVSTHHCLFIVRMHPRLSFISLLNCRHDLRFSPHSTCSRYIPCSTYEPQNVASYVRNAAQLDIVWRSPCTSLYLLPLLPFG
ncbi:hypothetical protein JB92DRAFT_2901955 [Gautieria morchelliformis]|nr:hypothetical protein JB92DRAFT_2901955 [Gautieria morchelliformis]